MLWDMSHRRPVAFAVEILRPRLAWPVMSRLADHVHLRPVDVHTLLVEAKRVEPGEAEYDAIAAKLRRLHDEGLAVRFNGHRAQGAHTHYDLTRLGGGLVASMNSLADFALDHYEQVVRGSRMHSEAADPGSPMPEWAVPRQYWTRRFATGVALGMLDTRWGFTILVHCVQGPARPGVIQDRINASLGNSPDLRGRRHLTASSFHETLGHLVRVGLLERLAEPRPCRAARVTYRPTPLGSAMLEALWPAACWGIAHDSELYRIVAARAGWQTASANPT